MALWKYSEGSSTLASTWSRQSLVNKIPSLAIEQANQEFQQEDRYWQHVPTKHWMHGNFRIFKFCVYLISYTRLFTKLNLYKILLYVTFFTVKISRSTVYHIASFMCWDFNLTVGSICNFKIHILLYPQYFVTQHDTDLMN